MPSDGVRRLQSNSFYYRNITTWNNLPKGGVDINNFQRKLDEVRKENPTKYNYIRPSDS